MGRKERARYLQELLEDYEDEQDTEGTQLLGTPGPNNPKGEWT